MQPGLLDRDVLELVDPRGVHQAEDTADAGLGIGLGDLAVGQPLTCCSFSVVVIFASSALTLASMPWLGAPRVGARAASSRDGGELGELLATEETARTVTAASAAPAMCFIRAPPRMGSRQPHGTLPVRALAGAVPGHTRFGKGRVPLEGSIRRCRPGGHGAARATVGGHRLEFGVAEPLILPTGCRILE